MVGCAYRSIYTDYRRAIRTHTEEGGVQEFKPQGKCLEIRHQLLELQPKLSVQLQLPLEQLRLPLSQMGLVLG
jgi:hypothetical protein